MKRNNLDEVLQFSALFGIKILGEFFACFLHEIDRYHLLALGALVLKITEKIPNIYGENCEDIQVNILKTMKRLTWDGLR